MNVYDSERMAEGLKTLGYKAVSSPETADLILVNTCAIRAKAEQKVFSFLGRLRFLKQEKPDLIIGVGGCVAQQEGKKLLRRLPHLDLVFGTHAVARLPGMIEKIEQSGERIADLAMSDRIEIPELSVVRPSPNIKKPSRFVTIMQGCDNYCTYCVVPYVRGREMSRNPEDILAEIRELVKTGVREVTLLGQNVNSYGKKEGLASFPDLLTMISEIDGLLRIRFTTSHPKDLSDEVIQAFGDLDKLCRHIHLPVQSGSDKILKKMNRKYSRKLYLEKIGKLRRICPDIAITSDMIVGFPGETRADFEATLELMRQVEYDSLFAFKYSDRPNAPAARFPDKASEEEKKDRLETLLELQKYYTVKKNELLVGTEQVILTDGLSKKQTASQPEGSEGVQWAGRTTTNKIVNFIRNRSGDADDPIFAGQMIRVRIDRAFSNSLWGCPLKTDLKGDEHYAA